VRCQMARPDRTAVKQWLLRQGDAKGIRVTELLKDPRLIGVGAIKSPD
jgi:hypothetical protein